MRRREPTRREAEADVAIDTEAQRVQDRQDVKDAARQRELDHDLFLAKEVTIWSHLGQD